MYDQVSEYEPPPPRSSLKKDAAFVYAGYFLRYLSLFVLIPYYGRVLGPASYGKVLAAMSVMNIVWMVVNYGFSTTGAREMASVHSRADRSRIFGRQIAARFTLLPIGLLIGIAGTLWSPILSTNIWFGILATVQGLLAAFNLGWLFQGVRRFRTGMMVEALSYPTTLIFVLLLVHSPDDGANVFVALVLASVICLTTAYTLARKSSGIIMQGLKVGLAEIRGASIIFLSSIGSIIITSGATYLLSLLSNSTQVGYFGAAERFVALGLGVMGPAGQVLMPTIANLHGGKHDGGADRAFRLAHIGLLLQFSYGLLVLFGGVLLSPYILPIIMGSQFMPSIPILQILSCIFPFSTFNNAVGMYVLIPLRKEKYLIYATAAAITVNITIGLMMAPAHGAIGMAIARLCSEVTGFGVLLFIMLKHGYLKKMITGKGH